MRRELGMSVGDGEGNWGNRISPPSGRLRVLKTHANGVPLNSRDSRWCADSARNHFLGG